MLFIDSCIPMYLIGADHPNKTRILELMPKFVMSRERFISSAECFQEILHRYFSLKDLAHLHIAYEALEDLSELVEPVTKEDTDTARNLIERHMGLSSRDCLHLAVMQRIRCDRIWTYDKRFDKISSIVRVH